MNTECYRCGIGETQASDAANTTECQALLTDLEQTPRRVQFHHADLESLIAWCMDEVFELAKSDENRERKMELVALEYRARLLLKRWKKQDRNWRDA